MKKKWGKKETTKWLTEIGEFLAEKCDEVGVDFLFMPYLNQQIVQESIKSLNEKGKVIAKKESHPSGLLTTFSGVQVGAALATLLTRAYHIQCDSGDIKKDCSFEEWLRPIIFTAIAAANDKLDKNSVVFKSSVDKKK